MNITSRAHEHAMEMPPQGLPFVGGAFLRRKCACGGTPGVDGECEQCRKKRLSLQRRAAEPANSGTVPAIVHEVLQSPGEPLNPAIRASTEKYFGHDFSKVRVHTDSRAAESAKRVNALAYTVRNDIVFGSGRYSPNSSAGKHLIAHELTHVVQQEGTRQMSSEIGSPNTPEELSAEVNADAALRGEEKPSSSLRSTTAKVARTVGSLTNCPANTNGALDNPASDLQDDDARALEIATNAATLLAVNPLAPETLQTFQTRFGLPPAEGTGFLNRLTGVVRPSQQTAIDEEIGILRRRYQIVARLFSQPISYRCIGGAASFAGCSPPNCDGGVFAWSCRGTGAIFVCPAYWNNTDSSVNERAAVLVHEAFHVNFGLSAPTQQGEVGDTVVQGSGRNFVVADCYSGFAADLAGVVNPADTCPAAP
jgi:uncharacterized protein DUF4157/lysine-specific metallo-endopeptidase family protein